ncbi:MAG: MarR family transcriptional regulator [Eubacteriales bacterium]|nr:MarR family transcriptional regulator [Eubacteriales bacterium]
MHPFMKEENGELTMQGLLMEINRLYMGKCFHQMVELGIYPGQIPVLGCLMHKDGLSQRELAKKLHIKPPTVNVTVQRLEKIGILCRRQDEKDQRVTRVYMTEKGHAIVEKAMEQVMENEKILFANFSETELCLMRRFFQQMLENIELLPGPSGEECIKKEGLDKC